MLDGDHHEAPVAVDVIQTSRCRMAGRSPT